MNTNETLISVTIHAERVESDGQGNYTVLLKGRMLTEAEQDLLGELFPTFTEQVWRMLNKETLIKSIVEL